jgi:dTDP-4-dehydrorhamnose reductase
MSKTAIIATGINGLVGSRFAELYTENYQLTALDLRSPTNPVDITSYEQVIKAIFQSPAEVVIHLAAMTSVDSAWQQRNDKKSLTYQVNVIGTDNVVRACQETNKYLIHISTAYVFDGTKIDPYLETDQPNPIEWYGQTKYEAEQLVIKSDLNWSILRIDQPFRLDSFEKKDVAHKIIERLQTNNLPPQFVNQYFGPTFIDDFARVLDFFVRTRITGLFHGSSGEQWTPFEFATLIKTIHQLPGEIRPGDLNEYLKTVNRPYQQNTALNCDKLKQVIDFELSSVEECVKKIKID